VMIAFSRAVNSPGRCRATEYGLWGLSNVFDGSEASQPHLRSALAQHERTAIATRVAHCDRCEGVKETIGMVFDRFLLVQWMESMAAA
jgi:hypothetical protein